MKYVLFCNLPYAFAILKPLEEEIAKRGFEFIWYVPSDIENLFPYKDSAYTTKIKDIESFESDFIFVPGNEVPHFLRGFKIQVFHGLAGEKKGHFKIRDYFDLYLTQGPYFTNRFQQLALKHKNFDVIETGWCKLDKLYKIDNDILVQKEKLLSEYNAKKIILYSPTFSPSLTSGEVLLPVVEELSNLNDIVVIIKFHDKMDSDILEQYKQLKAKNLILSDEKDITPLLQMSDLMISDTSSVVYEFALLDKPVVTLNSISENINWLNLKNTDNFKEKVLEILDGKDNFADLRRNVILNYHPYNDSKSAFRMIEASLSYAEKFPIPQKRKLSLLRKIKIYKNYTL